MVEPLRHRQTKEAETDMSNLQPPRHIPTLPWLCENARQRGLMRRDFSEVAAISHLAEFRAFSFGKGS
jgi:hypothetical protein